MAKKSRKLSGIKINEISLVDLPANKQSFLFFKRDGSEEKDLVEKAKKIKIGIESDGTVGGTTISVNGKKLVNLRNFDFNFYGTDPKSTIHASYSKESSDEGGFKRTETYYLSKGDVMDSKVLKVLQKYLDTDEIDFEKKASDEEIQKALVLITEQYQESFPEDLENAIGLIAKCAADRRDVEKDDKDDLEKAGAKFSKDVLKKLQAVLAAVEALKTVLPEAGTSTQKSDGNVSDEVAKQIASLGEAVSKLSKEKGVDKNTSKEDLQKTLEALTKRLSDIERGGAVKKSIADDADDDDNGSNTGSEDDKVKWPTITGQK